MEPLTRTILSTLRRDRLRALADRLGVQARDRRARASLEAALTSGATSAALLAALDADDLRAACSALTLPSEGAREDLEARLRAFRERAQRVAVLAREDDRAAGLTFTALDFETADYGRDSACAIALVRVVDGVIVEEKVQLLRPPRQRFVFTYIHGLTWEDVKDAPTFAQAWPELEPLTRGARFLAAHNASFDRSVLRACAREAGLPEPAFPFTCTMKVARQAWNVYPTKLPDVCRRLGIPLNHHEALSDARACAQIVMEAGRSGYLALV